MEPPDDDDPTGVPIPVYVYKCDNVRAGPSSDNGTVSVDGLRVAISQQGNNSETVTVDQVFQNADELDVVEHALIPLLTSCVNGINSCLLCGGSSSTIRSTFFHGTDNGPTHAGVAATLLQNLLLLLADKHGSGNQPPQTPRFFVRLSFVELYEETIVDLLAPKPSSSGPVVAVALRQDKFAGVDFKNATKVGPIQSSTDVVATIQAAIQDGRRRRRTGMTSLGPVTDFTSAILRVYVKQVPTAGPVVQSTLDVVDLPSFDRLTKASAVRLTEGPLVNKALYAFESVCKACESAASFPPYDSSILTQVLHHALGGDALTHALLFVAPSDHDGAKATWRVAAMLQHMRTFPLAHSDVVQGLRRRHNAERLFWQTQRPHDTNVIDGTTASLSTMALVQKTHDLEGKLMQDSIEKSKLKDVIDAHVKSLAEYRTKVAGLVEIEVGLRKQLLDREREKLSLSKALVDCQLEHSTVLEALEKDKFDVTTKLLNAENDLLELQMREEHHDTQLRAAQDAATAAVADKKELAIEFVALKANFVAVNKSLQAQSAKAQQLSVELLTLVNQKAKLAASVEDLEKAKADGLERERKLGVALDKASAQEQALMNIIAAEKTKSNALYEEKVALDFQLKSILLDVEAHQVQFEKTAQQQAQAQHAQVLAFKQEAEEEMARRQARCTELEERGREMESMTRQLRREIDELERALALRTNEVSDLRREMTRAALEMDDQTASYRAKLVELFGDKAVWSTDGGAVADDALVAAARSAWTASYESRERDLVQRLAAFEERHTAWSGRYDALYRVTMKMRGIIQDHGVTCSDLPEDLDAWSREAAAESHASDVERRRVAAKVDACTQELRLQVEKNLQAAETFKGILSGKERDLAAVRSQLDAALAARDQLQQQNDRLVQDKSNDKTKDEMKRMQDVLVAQLQELKMQLQPLKQDGKATPTGMDDAHELRAQVRKLEDKLRSAQTTHMQAVEATERRCAELTTKAIMLEEEVVGLKNLLKTTTKKHRERVLELTRE
ncbi:hypothetical protein H310_02882 [Aphanomyces invadans]|uniref:Kinesin motor domain-containing protein n=1 Tax=Aphanomyces invadans TaxID=157072 RepID=A0A024UJS1_9STRA|nr:hypothetical protein H310_02882 [Aphanomyces invadans]ETW06701.1 hypothetical protein H310_02882 [Aphanomyces invadans]|eukprot:XP_008864776.1 hypothetical protein H310_02882 [Aphanomyces invadans]